MSRESPPAMAALRSDGGAVIYANPTAPALTDDRPVNEYYLLDRWLGPGGAAAPK